MGLIAYRVTGIEEMINELDRIGSLPREGAMARMEATLQTAFADTQSRVHVHTGLLKSTGRTSSERGRGTWEGTISYGPAPGAFYEIAAGGSHDFLAGAPLILDELLEIAEDDLAGRSE